MSVEGSHSAGQRNNLEAQILALLSDTSPRTIAQLAAALAAPPFAVRLALKRLHRRGGIVCAGRTLEYRTTFGARGQHWAAMWTVPPIPPNS